MSGAWNLPKQGKTVSRAVSISKFVDKHIPAKGVGTPTERLRIKLHKELSEMIDTAINQEKTDLEILQYDYIVWLADKLDRCEAFLNNQSGWKKWTKKEIESGYNQRAKIEKLQKRK